MSIRRPAVALPFLAIGIAFLALGLAGQRTFLFTGIVFLAIAAAFAIRGRKPSR